MNEAKKISSPVEVWPESSKAKFNAIPDSSHWKLDKEGAYFHYCDNETIHGVEFN